MEYLSLVHVPTIRHFSIVVTLARTLDGTCPVGSQYKDVSIF